LIVTLIDEAQAQYRLLDTTRAYALETLEEYAEVEVVFAGMQNPSPDTSNRKELRCWLWQRPNEPQPIPVHR
jgi:hypothetical protein